MARRGRPARRRLAAGTQSGCTGRVRSSTGPIARPYALHRNGYAGMQRYAAFLWSGDVDSTWATLKTHVPVAINTGLTRHPVLGHGYRRLRPDQGVDGRTVRALVPVRRVLPAVPLARPDVEAAPALGLEHRRARAERDPRLRIRREPRSRRTAQRAASSRSAASTWSCATGCCPICTASVRECCLTGLPMMRALWLHYPDDPVGRARRRRVPLGPEHPGRAGGRERRHDSAALSAPRASGTTSGRTNARGRPRDQPAM